MNIKRYEGEYFQQFERKNTEDIITHNVIDRNGKVKKLKKTNLIQDLEMKKNHQALLKEILRGEKVQERKKRRLNEELMKKRSKQFQQLIETKTESKMQDSDNDYMAQKA